jgi:hypothetical protein
VPRSDRYATIFRPFASFEESRTVGIRALKKATFKSSAACIRMNENHVERVAKFAGFICHFVNGPTLLS